MKYMKYVEPIKDQAVQKDSWPLKVGPIDCPETLVNNYAAWQPRKIKDLALFI